MFELVIHERGSFKKYLTSSEEVQKPRIRLVKGGVVEYIKTKTSEKELPEISITNNGTKYYLDSEVDIFDFEKVVESRKNISVVPSVLSFKKLQTVNIHPFLSDTEHGFRWSVTERKFFILDKDDFSILDEFDVDFPTGESIYSTSGAVFEKNKIIVLGFLKTYIIDYFKKEVKYLKSYANEDKMQSLAYGRLLPDSKLMSWQGSLGGTKNDRSPCMFNLETFDQIYTEVSKINTSYYQTMGRPVLDYFRKVHTTHVGSGVTSTNFLLTYDLKTQEKLINTLPHGMHQIGKMILDSKGEVFSFPYEGKSTSNHPIYKKNTDGSFSVVANLSAGTVGAVPISNTNQSVVLGKDGWIYSVGYESKWLTRFNPDTYEVENYDMTNYGIPTTVMSKNLFYSKNQDLILSMSNYAQIRIIINDVEKNLSLESPFFKY